MDLLETLKKLIAVISEFLKKLFTWKDEEVADASEAISEYMSSKEAEAE